MSDREVDQQLVERAQRGEKAAFELLVVKYQRKLERLLSRVIRDPAEIEDVAQEAFIVLQFDIVAVDLDRRQTCGAMRGNRR